MRILIAEDDITSRAMLIALLRKWGYEPVVTENGVQALAAAQQPDAPSLLLLDWSMPEMDGVDVVRRVREVETSTPPYIIMLTSKDDAESVVAGLEAGASDYICKPYDSLELRARLRVGQRLLELQAKLVDARDALAHEATHDYLTGVMNRRALLAALSRELARAKREHTGLSVGICDIDHFKQINDAHGHPVGDEVLCGLVRRLQCSLREYDYVGRWGGEEFVMIVLGVAGDSGGRPFERAQEMVAGNPVPTMAGSLSVTVSIGAAVWNGTQTSDQLLAAADRALYQAKEQGRNRTCLAVP
jgi:two-component system, cell cycle response regulator